MKKIAISLSVLLLTACGIYAGDISPWREKNSIFEMWQTNNITYYDPEDMEYSVSESRLITEDDIKRGEFLITQTGGIMAYSRTYRSDFLNQETLRANKDAILSATYSPFRIKKSVDYQGFGEVKIDGESYMMVRESDRESDVLLINGNGEVYNKLGRIVKGRLALIDTPFYLEPDDVIFTPVSVMRTEKSDYDEGFELRYNGIENDQMLFLYTILGEECVDEEYAFPIMQDMIEIHDLNIKVIGLSPKQIEYTIL